MCKLDLIIQQSLVEERVTPSFHATHSDSNLWAVLNFYIIVENDLKWIQIVLIFNFFFFNLVSIFCRRYFSAIYCKLTWHFSWYFQFFQNWSSIFRKCYHLFFWAVQPFSLKFLACSHLKNALKILIDEKNFTCWVKEYHKLKVEK